MTAAKFVYVIASGEYSDYRVLAMVDGTEKQAEDLARRANLNNDYRDYRAEALPVVAPDVQQIVCLSMQENIWDDGTTDEHHVRLDTRWPFDLLWEEEGRPVAAQWVRAPIHRGVGGRLEVRGTDHERVRKTFGDLRAALLTDEALRARKEFRR
jgi:hypothetical protein